MDEDLWERIEDFRYSNRIPARSEAIRMLIEAGLKSLEGKVIKPAKGSQKK